MQFDTSICQLLETQITLDMLLREVKDPENDISTIHRILRHEPCFSDVPANELEVAIESQLTQLGQRIQRWQTKQRNLARNRRQQEGRERRRLQLAIGDCFCEDMGLLEISNRVASIDWSTEANQKLRQSSIKCVSVEEFSVRLNRLGSYANHLYECRPGSVVASNSSAEQYREVLAKGLEMYNCKDYFDAAPSASTTTERAILWSGVGESLTLEESGWLEKANQDKFCHLGAKLSNTVYDFAGTVEQATMAVEKKDSEHLGENASHYMYFWSMAGAYYNLVYGGELEKQIKTQVLGPLLKVLPKKES